MRPEGTPASERVVYSGNIVRRGEEGYLYFVGRRDRLIKTLGYRVNPDEVTELIHKTGEVVEVEATVITEQDVTNGEAIVAHLMLTDDGSPDRLRRFCRREAPHLQPQRYEVHDSLPRTPDGKHDLEKLRRISSE